MATQLASIGVGKLSSTAKYVDTFIVEIYSDSGYTVKIGQQTSTAQWNGSAWVQKDAIIFGGLVFGTTYYLRAAVIAPTSGAISAWTTFNTAAGSASAPGCTYTGTFTATTSGIGYIVTPASVPSDIDHFEAVWVWDSSTPASTIGAYWNGQITNSNITFFVGGKPGDTAKVYVRAVNTSQQAQAWQLIDTRTVSTTWSGTTIGTIGDGTLLGTGGPSVNSGSTGRLGLAGAVGAAFLTGFGATAAMSSAGNTGFNSIDTTPTTGRTYEIYSGSGLYVNVDNTAGLNRTFLNSSGAYSIGGGAASDNIFTANGSTSGAPGRMGVSGTDTFVRQAATTVARSYGMYNTGGNYNQFDETASANRTTINTSGQYGIGGAPGNIFDIHGGQYATISAGAGGWHTFDTNVSGIGAYFLSGNVAAGNISINRDGTGNVAQWNSNGMGVGITPNQALTVATGFLGVNLQGTQPSVLYNDTGNSRGWGFGARGGPALEMSDETAGVGRVYLSTGGGYGIGASPGSDFYFTNSNRSYFQGAGPGIAVNDTQASGRLYMMLSGSGQAQGYQIYNGTNANYPLMIDNSARTGLGAFTPANPLDVNGQLVSHAGGAGLYTADRTSGLLHAFYADAGYARINNPTGGDVVTINRSTGNLGIGGTYTGDWISVQGTSILDGSKVLQANLANADKIAADGTTYGRPRMSQLQTGVVIGRSFGKSLLGNGGFESNNCGTPLNTDVATGGNVSDEWYAHILDTFNPQIDTAAPRSGSQCLVLHALGTTSVPASSTHGSRVFTKMLIPIKQGDIVRVNGFIRADFSGSPNAGISLQAVIGFYLIGPDGVTLLQEQFASQSGITGALGYTKLDASLQVPAVAGGQSPTYMRVQCTAFVVNANGSATTIGNDCAIRFDDILAVLQNTAFDLTPINTASTITSNTSPLSQSGTSSTILVASKTFQFGDGQISYNSGSVNPGSIGTWFVYADDPTFSGGAVTFVATVNPWDTVAANGRILFGEITTVGGGGATGTGAGTGGGGPKGKGVIGP